MAAVSSQHILFELPVMKPEWDRGGAEAQDKDNSAEKTVELAVQLLVVETVAGLEFPQAKRRHHQHGDDKDDVLFREEADKPEINDADHNQQDIDREDEGRYIDKGGRQVAREIPVADIVSEANDRIDDAYKKAGHHGLEEDGILFVIHIEINFLRFAIISFPVPACGASSPENDKHVLFPVDDCRN